MEGKENVSENKADVKTPLFVEEIPKCGSVAMLFYIPDTCTEKESLQKLILTNGGCMAVFHECFTIQIATPEDAKEPDFGKNYYRGVVYSSDWISDCIKEGKLLPKEKYPIRKIAEGREIEFGKGKLQYTIREAIMVFDWIKDKKLKNSRRTWQQMVDQGVLL